MRSRLVIALWGGLAMACQDEGSASKEAEEPSAADAADEADEAADEAEAEPKCPQARVPLASRMGATIAKACEEAAIEPMAKDPAVDLALIGQWKGEYDGDATDPVEFEADLLATEGRVSGTTTEPNTFSYVYGYSQLEADLVGDAHASRQVILLKTYRTGSVDHSVLYVGMLDEPGRRIEGHWMVGGTRGTFWMTKQ